MKRINLVKYGFVRCATEDFTDDSNRFTCYRVGNVRVSKCMACGDVYIAASRYDCTLAYEDYSKLPHFKDLRRLNGVSVASLTEEDLIKLYNDCVAYDAEYEDAISKVVWPTIEELATARHEETEVRKAELAEVEAAFTLDKAASLNEYALKNFFSYYKSLKLNANTVGTDEEWARNIYRKPYSKSFMQSHSKGDYLEQSFYYKQCLEYLSK